MIVPDLNLLIFAHNRRSPDHEVASRWWRSQLAGAAGIAIPWVVALGFIRITTSARVLAEPLDVEAAVDVVRSWFEAPGVFVPEPGPDHRELVFDLLTQAGTAGDLTNDAHIAALAMEYGAEVATADQDFARFPKVRWFNPLSL